jgi:hypothetical protein
MAIVNNSEYEGFSGRLGNIIFRQRNGKTVAYRVPGKIKKSESEASVAVRKKLTPMSQFAANICSLPELKFLWEFKKDIKAKSAYHKIEKYNARLFDSLRPTIRNRIVPEGFGCNLDSIILNKDELRAEISFSRRAFAKEEEIKKFLIIFVICFYDPIDKKDVYFTFYNIYKQVTDWSPGTPLETEYQFIEDQGEIFSCYRKSILYYTVFTIDGEGCYLEHSSSKSREIEIIPGQKANN